MANTAIRCVLVINVPNAAYDGVAECMKLIQGLIYGMHDDFDTLDVTNEDEMLQLGKESLAVSWPRPRRPEILTGAEKRIIPFFRALKKTINGHPLDCSFHWELQRDSSAPPATLMIRHTESIDLDSVVAVVQAIAECVPELQETAPWSLTFAEVSDFFPRVDSFGGGAVVFGVGWKTSFNAHQWASQMKEAHSFKIPLAHAIQAAKP